MIIRLIISFFLLIVGSAMLIIWIADINNKPDIDFSEGFFRAREKQSGNIFCFHIIAETISSLSLIAGGLVLLSGSDTFMPVVYFSLGALFYSSVNSLGWAFAETQRKIYRLPMMLGLAVSLGGFVLLMFPGN
jgi:hypothetical protein